MATQSVRGQTLEQRLAFPQPVQCLARFAALRQRPGGGGDPPGKVEEEGPRPGHRDPALNPQGACAQSPLRRWSTLAANRGHADGEGMLGRFGDPDRLGFGFGRFVESSELREAHDQASAIPDRRRATKSESLVDPIGRQRGKIVGGKFNYPIILSPGRNAPAREGSWRRCAVLRSSRRPATSSAREPDTNASSSSPRSECVTVMNA